MGHQAAVGWLGSMMACSHGVYHRVQAGENLYRIGKAYGIGVQQLAHVNHLADPSRLEVGQRLFIPGARRELPVVVITPRATDAHPPLRGPTAPHPVFVWPVAGGTVTSGFGRRGRSFHDGIDIKAPAGAAVLAAQDGEVVYSDVLRGYGNVIILRHAHGFATVYAHNQRNRLRQGARVRRGDVIGTVGTSGHTSGSSLHFEVRQDNVARDPLYFLPPLEQVAAPEPRGGRGG
jgi:lipoprotein NlpD